jgi:hypothetical protein
LRSSKEDARPKSTQIRHGNWPREKPAILAVYEASEPKGAEEPCSEGSVTVGVGAISAFFKPEYPHNAKILTPIQRDLAVWRIESESGAAGGTEDVSTLPTLSQAPSFTCSSSRTRCRNVKDRSPTSFPASSSSGATTAPTPWWLLRPLYFRGVHVLPHQLVLRRK